MGIEKSKAEKAHQIRYPSSADARGSTRVHYLRRPYYLGPYDSPQSYIMFGLWKHGLMESGEPPQSKELRRIVDTLLQDESRERPRPVSTYLPTLLSSGICLLLGFLIAFAIFSTSSPLKVDGTRLTEEEVEFVRGLRKTEQTIEHNPLTDASRVAAMTQKLMDEDIDDGLLHDTKKDFRMRRLRDGFRHRVDTRGSSP